MPSIPRVTIGWIHPFLEILAEVGTPYEAILERAELPSLAVDDPSILVPTAKVYRFVELAVREAALPDLGLRAGARIDLDTLLPDAERSWTRPGVFRSIRNSQTLVFWSPNCESNTSQFTIDFTASS